MPADCETSSSVLTEPATVELAPEQVLSKLIARLEQASGPDRELDADIERAFNPRLAKMRHDHNGWLVGGGQPMPHLCSEFTASIDAVLTLVPEGATSHGYELDTSSVEAFVSRNNVASGHWYREGAHKTSPAIALCIAALKARLLASGTADDHPNSGSSARGI